MDKSLLAEIFVPTFDDDGKDGGGKIGAIGTGYPVAHDVILTARHVIEPKDRHNKYPICVRWHGSNSRRKTSSGGARAKPTLHCCAAHVRTRQIRISDCCPPRGRVRVIIGLARVSRPPRSAMISDDPRISTARCIACRQSGIISSSTSTRHRATRKVGRAPLACPFSVQAVPEFLDWRRKFRSDLRPKKYTLSRHSSSW